MQVSDRSQGLIQAHKQLCERWLSACTPGASGSHGGMCLEVEVSGGVRLGVCRCWRDQL